ncbi:MAG: hypothetical protein ABIS28_08240 [Caldimonas sp.]
MKFPFAKSPLAIAAVAVVGATAMTGVPADATAAPKDKKVAGEYVTGDFHNHTTCSDGSISMQKLVKKSTGTTDTPWGLDWFVQAGHGGSGNRNCTLTEDASLGTPAYPYTGAGPTTTWAASIGAANIKGLNGGVGGNGNMWRWQSIQEFQYPLLEYLAAAQDKPLFIGVESVAAGHEHTSMSVITGQMPSSLDHATLPTSTGYSPLGNATALAQWEYCFDRNDADTSRGNTTGTAIGNNWNCAVTGSLNAADPSWSATAQKLIPAGGTGTGTRGHLKTVEAVKWMAENHPNASYYVPAHLERAGPFNPNGNNGFNIEHLRNFNNAAPRVAFGFETQPGHGASSDRGEYSPRRNNIGGVLVDSVGGTTYGGTGIYGAYVGGVWDALLGEGRGFWFFASSDWHNRGIFGPDDRRTTQDFYPGEYQRDFVMVRNSKDKKLRPQTIVDGLRSGNSFTTSGQLIDRLAFVACESYPTGQAASHTTAPVLGLAHSAAVRNTDVDRDNCATMGEKLVVRPGSEIVVAIVVRDPSGTNYAPYAFPNPSLAQIGISQPLNAPVLDHIDLIRGMVTGYKAPSGADYAGAWPSTWLANPDPATIPAAAKNTTAAVVKTFNGSTWKKADGDFLQMTHRIPAVTASQYIRLRGTNLPASVPNETDANGNPLPDLYTNASGTANLRIKCDDAGCPAHLAVVNGQRYSTYDVAAWADLWFYSNPIFIEVSGSTMVAGVK